MVEDEASFLQNVFMYADLSVAGKISADKIDVTGNATIGNKLSVDGNADFASDVKMTGLNTLNNLSNPNLEILFSLPSGQLKKVGINQLKDLIVETAYKYDCADGGDVPFPTWANGLNKIFSPCPQVNVGIGTDDPEYKLTVIGKTYSNKLLLGNKFGSSDAVINGYTTNDNADLMMLAKKLGATGAEEIRFFVSKDGEVEKTQTAFNTEAFSFSVFPNPNNGNFQLINPFDEISVIIIYDLNGKLVYEITLEPGVNQIDTGLDKGLYLITLTNGEANFYTKMITQ